jgi:hypothetical protein
MIKELVRQAIQEAFTDIGRTPSWQLQKGYPLEQGDEDNFNQVSGRVFHQILTRLIRADKLRDTPKGLEDLSVYSVAEYDKMMCFIGKNNTAGYALTRQGELVSVFSTARSAGHAIVADAVRRGAKKLDCFAEIDSSGRVDGLLYRLYSRHGFKIDRSLTTGQVGEPYAIINGISYYVNSRGEVEMDNPTVVVFMKR